MYRQFKIKFLHLRVQSYTYKHFYSLIHKVFSKEYNFTHPKRDLLSDFFWTGSSLHLELANEKQIR